MPTRGVIGGWSVTEISDTKSTPGNHGWRGPKPPSDDCYRPPDLWVTLALLIGWADEHLVNTDMLRPRHGVRNRICDVLTLERCDRVEKAVF